MVHCTPRRAQGGRFGTTTKRGLASSFVSYLCAMLCKADSADNVPSHLYAPLYSGPKLRGLRGRVPRHRRFISSKRMAHIATPCWGCRPARSQPRARHRRPTRPRVTPQDSHTAPLGSVSSLQQQHLSMVAVAAPTPVRAARVPVLASIAD